MVRGQREVQMSSWNLYIKLLEFKRCMKRTEDLFVCLIVFFLLLLLFNFFWILLFTFEMTKICFGVYHFGNFLEKKIRKRGANFASFYFLLRAPETHATPLLNGHPEYSGIYLSGWKHWMPFKTIHFSPENAKSRVGQSQECYLHTTHLGCLNLKLSNHFENEWPRYGLAKLLIYTQTYWKY